MSVLQAMRAEFFICSAGSEDFGGGELKQKQKKAGISMGFFESEANER